MSYLKRTGTGINDVTWDETLLATEDYVNTTVTTAVPDGKFVETTGGTMTGELVLSGKPTQDNGAATKKYVDDALGGAAPAGDYLLKTGDTMTGNLNMSDNQITNVNTMTATNIIVKGTSDASASIKVTGDVSRSELNLNDASNNPVVLKGINIPVDNNDAANKQYVDAVDTKVTNLEGEVTGVKNNVTNITNGSTELPYLPIAGGTLTGALTLSGDPTADLQAATKAYIDTKANDHQNISLLKGTDVTKLDFICLKHNKFLFLNISYVMTKKLNVGTNNEIFFTINTSEKLLDMNFHMSDLSELFNASGDSLGYYFVDILLSIKNNVVSIINIAVPSSPLGTTTVALQGGATHMLAFVE